jgi:hypothetical protein
VRRRTGCVLDDDAHDAEAPTTPTRIASTDVAMAIFAMKSAVCGRGVTRNGAFERSSLRVQRDGGGGRLGGIQ